MKIPVQRTTAILILKTSKQITSKRAPYRSSPSLLGLLSLLCWTPHDLVSTHLYFFCFHKIRLTILSRVLIDALGVFGETSGGLALQKMHEKMLSSAEGQSVLSDKPRINTKTVNLDHLRGLPPNSLGRAYVKFLEDNVSRRYLVQTS